MATNTKSSNLMRSKPSFGDGPSSSRPKFDSSASKKKVAEASIRNSAADLKNRSTSSTASKMTKKTSTQSKDVAKKVTKPREKKVYSLPGQKFDVPEEREPLRIFYESLSKQIPSSEMAEFWLMEHGMLSPERAKRAFERKQRKQKQLRTGTPIKSPPPRTVTTIKSPPPRTVTTIKSPPASTSSKPESSKRPQPVSKNSDVKAKKRIVDDSEDDDDFVLSHKRRKG